MLPKKRSPNNLTSTQLVLLSAAVQREDGAIELAPNLKGAATDKVVSKLLRDGLIEEIPARGALPIWRRDEEKEAVALRITTRGLAAIGIEEHRALLEAEENSGTPACNKPARRASAKEPIEAVDSGPALLPMPDRHYANPSLSTAEPVSAPPKRKLENGEQRPAPETRAQRTEMPEIARQRPAPAILTHGNVADSHTPGNNTPETRLPREDSNS
jgi:hypothetical protein